MSLSNDPVKRIEQLEAMKKGRENSRQKKAKLTPLLLTSKKYKTDIVRFANEQFFIETKRPIVLESFQIEEIIKPLFYSGKAYHLAVIGLTKKEGKSTLASIVALHKVLYGNDFSEIYICANDLEQGQHTIFSKIVRCIELNRRLFAKLKVTTDKIENKETGSFIQVLPQDFKGSGGFSPCLVIFDELWGFQLENARRFFELLCENPARPDFLCLIISHAGYEKAGLLYELYESGLDNKNSDYFFYWSHENKASWKTKGFLNRQRYKPGMRPNLYKRLYQNQWVDSERNFFTEGDYNSCLNRELRPALSDKNLLIFVGVDASVTGDASAVVAVTRTLENKIRLIGYRIWQPTRIKKMNLDMTIARYLRELYQNFRVKKIVYDPYQLHSLMQNLKSEGLPCEELAQTQGNTISYSQLLYELIHYGNIEFYPNKELREHILNASIKESNMGFRLVKGHYSKKIDLAVALAMAVYSCSQQKITTRVGRVYDRKHGFSSNREGSGVVSGKIFYGGELKSGGVKTGTEKLKLKILGKKTEKKRHKQVYFRGIGD